MVLRAGTVLPGAAAFMALRDRLATWQVRLAGDARFRAWAARFPLTRPIARRRAAELFDLCAGFVYSQALSACLTLNLFEMLRGGALPAATIARRTGLAPDVAARLLDAAAALRLVAPTADGRYGLGPLGAALLDNPGVAAMVAHHALLYDDLRDPVAMLRDGRGAGLSAFWSYARSVPGVPCDAAPAGAYSALMTSSQPMVAEEVAAAYRFDGHRRILDIGGGDGCFLAAIAPHAPGASLILLDVPPVAARARARFASVGLASRAEAIGCDFRTDPLPAGADLVTLVRVLHDHDDAVVAALLHRVRGALVPGGRILIAEPMAATRGAERMGAAYFGVYLLAMGQGRPRRSGELMAMLRDAGFVRPRMLRMRIPLIVSVLVAERTA
ncbi:methyltransferase [Humitalea sp. 24SJ18S-53]|uniref:methyltransferase n=1 Tax=Humitalea sp. 24SJ18S-53 TaxID=3422307 RepID=UPI003D665CC4